MSVFSISLLPTPTSVCKICNKKAILSETHISFVFYDLQSRNANAGNLLNEDQYTSHITTVTTSPKYEYRESEKEE
jgi:hypothetical protein